MKKYAILIGINQYHESLGRLKYSVNDCRRLAQVLTTGDDAFSAENVIVLADDDQTDHRPTYANIHSWLASWLAQPGEDDTILVFFAGHGREIDGKCYLVPGDATLQTIHVTGIPVPYIQELLNRCKARQKVLILDACHSGAGRDVMTMSSTMQSTLSKAKGIYTITSCGANETSHEWEDKKQGLFSYYFAQALSGQCPPNATGILTLEGIYEWVYEKVSGWAVRHRCSQNPQRFSQGMGAMILNRCSVKRCHPSKQQKAATEKITVSTENIIPSLSPARRFVRPETMKLFLRFLRTAVLVVLIFCLLIVSGMGIVRWNTLNIAAINEADQFIIKNEPENSLKMLDDSIMLPWNFRQKTKTYKRAALLRSLNQGMQDALRGKTEIVYNYLNSRDTDFIDHVNSTLATQLPMLKENATKFLQESQYKRVVDICRLFPGNTDFENIKNDAKNKAIEKSHEAAQNGEVQFLESIIQIFGSDDKLYRALYQANLVKNRSQNLSIVEAAAKQGKVEDVKRISEGYENDNEFQVLLAQAQSVKKRIEELSEAIMLAKAGEVEKTKRIASAYPNDTEFIDCVRDAERTVEKDEKLLKAELAAQDGKLEEVQLIAKDYPNDPNFAAAVSTAIIIAEKNSDLLLVENAVKSKDILTAIRISEKYGNENFFIEIIKPIRIDGEYHYVLGQELKANENDWARKKVKVSGQVTDVKYTSSGIVSSAKILTEDGQYALWVNLDSDIYTRAIVDRNKNFQTQELTIWGVFKEGSSRSISSVELIAVGTRCSLMEIENKIIEAENALINKDFEKTSDIQKPYYGSKWRNLATRTITAQKEHKILEEKRERENRFKSLPKDGVYTAVQGKDLYEFIEELNNRKVVITGVLLSDPESNMGPYRAKFEAMDGAKLTQIALPYRLFPNSYRSGPKSQGLVKGAYVKIWGMFEYKKGIFSDDYRIDPVDKWEIIESN